MAREIIETKKRVGDFDTAPHLTREQFLEKCAKVWDSKPDRKCREYVLAVFDESEDGDNVEVNAACREHSMKNVALAIAENLNPFMQKEIFMNMGKIIEENDPIAHIMGKMLKGILSGDNKDSEAVTPEPPKSDSGLN